jgi:hypothetical protein
MRHSGNTQDSTGDSVGTSKPDEMSGVLQKVRGDSRSSLPVSLTSCVISHILVK